MHVCSSHGYHFRVAFFALRAPDCVTTIWGWHLFRNTVLPGMSCMFTNLSSPTCFWAYNSQGSLTNKDLSWLKAIYSARKGAATKVRGTFVALFWQKGEMAHPVLTKEFYSQPQQWPCCVTWSVTYTASPYPTLSASAKPIFEMGCTEITCGQSHIMEFQVISY